MCSLSAAPASADQVPVQDLERQLFDVLVVGAGPAGALAALALAQAGHRVGLIDRQRFPRNKVCGDALIADSLAVLDAYDLGNSVRTAGHSLDAVRVFSPSQIQVDLPGEFVTIRRDALDALVARAAVAEGATFAVGDVGGLEESQDRVRIRFRATDTQLAARFVILATGADTRLAERSGLATQRQASAVAARCYVRSTAMIDRLVVSFDRAILPGYGWIFPLGGGIFNVGCGLFYRDAAAWDANLRSMFDAFLADFPLARALMADGQRISALKGARLRCGLTGVGPYPGGRIVAIGETIGTTFPFTGEGIGKAMETGVLAAGHLDRALAAGTTAPLRGLSDAIATKLKPRYRGYELAQTWLTRAWLSDLLAKRMRKSAYLRAAAAGILNETVDPKALFSVRGVLTSLVR